MFNRYFLTCQTLKNKFTGLTKKLKQEFQLLESEEIYRIASQSSILERMIHLLNGFERYHYVRTNHVRASGCFSIFVSKELYLTLVPLTIAPIGCLNEITFCRVNIPPNSQLPKDIVNLVCMYIYWRESFFKFSIIDLYYRLCDRTIFLSLAWNSSESFNDSANVIEIYKTAPNWYRWIRNNENCINF